MSANNHVPGNKTVLVVDDDHDILFAIRAAIESRGYRVITASDGNAGLNVAERERPDMVIVDMMMPKKSGFLVLERLKAKNREWSPKMIMITANEGSRHKAYAEYLGVIDYIRKPFAMERLLEAVDKGLSTDSKTPQSETDPGKGETEKK